MSEEVAWDPEDDKQRPAWSSRRCCALLAGQDWKRVEPRFARGGESDALYPIDGFVFSCGCIVTDDAGWRSCGAGLHALLAESRPESELVQRYRRLRAVFDTVLKAAWQSEPREPEHFYEFFVEKARRVLLPFERWQTDHDLAQKPIWQNGNLYADLTAIPGARRLALYADGGSHPKIALQFREEWTGSTDLGEDLAAASAVCVPRP